MVLQLQFLQPHDLLICLEVEPDLCCICREKIYLFSGSGDLRKFDSTSGSFEDDGMSTDDGVQSFKSTPTHPSYNDRITIEDFDILKLISRGTFGRVFLAKKRATGDNFAIKVRVI